MGTGTFIVVEGLNGSGKTTQVHLLGQALERAYPGNVVVTSEPWTSPHGVMIREMLRAERSMTTPKVLAMLFAADRLVHCEQCIAPALTAGKIVVCDRYVPSSVAYQGPWVTRSDGVPEDLSIIEGCNWVATLNYWTLTPDLTIVLGIDPEDAQRRMQARSAQDVIDRDQRMAKAAARIYYSLLPRILRGEAITMIDAADDEEAVARRILQAANTVIDDSK